MRTTTRTALLLAGALLAACGADTQTPEGQSTAPVGATYTVRGRVLEMPTEPGGQIRLEHEAVHDLVDYRGEVVGMDAMTMFFPLTEAAASKEIVAGDIVEFDLYVDWEADPLSTVTRLEELPADTELIFGPAKPSTE